MSKDARDCHRCKGCGLCYPVLHRYAVEDKSGWFHSKKCRNDYLLMMGEDADREGRIRDAIEGSEALTMLEAALGLFKESEEGKSAMAAYKSLEKYGLVIRDNAGTLNIIFNPQETEFRIGGNHISVWKKQPLENASAEEK